MDRRQFFKGMFGVMGLALVAPAALLAKPAIPMPIPQQPLPEPEPVGPIIEIDGNIVASDDIEEAWELGQSMEEFFNVPYDYGRKTKAVSRDEIDFHLWKYANDSIDEAWEMVRKRKGL